MGGGAHDIFGNVDKSNGTKMTRFIAALFVSAACATCAATAQAASTPYEICLSPLLSHQQRALCQEQIDGARTVAEQKKIQAKFRDRVKEAEDAQKEKEKKGK